VFFLGSSTDVTEPRTLVFLADSATPFQHAETSAMFADVTTFTHLYTTAAQIPVITWKVLYEYSGAQI